MSYDDSWMLEDRYKILTSVGDLVWSQVCCSSFPAITVLHCADRACMILRMRTCLFTLLIMAGAVAQEPETAAQITELSRKMQPALDIVLGGRGRQVDSVERRLFILIDPTPSVQASTFVSTLGHALKKHAKRLQKTYIGLGRVGLRGVVTLDPTLDHVALLSAVETELKTTDAAIHNVYQDIRTLAGKLAGKAGKREILLVSFDNGDAEDDVDATAAVCKKHAVSVTALTSESYLSDSYWRGRSAAGSGAPRGTQLTGGDNPYIDLPYHWLFQQTTANEMTPSGFACYGINRVVAVSGGRVFLYAPPSDTRHSCGHRTVCLFCSGDHIPVGESYQSGRMSMLAPTTKSRKAAFKDAAGDAFTRDVLVAWRDASKNGILRSGPPLRFAGTSAKAERNRRGRKLSLFTLGFKRNATKADKAGKECDRMIRRLDDRLSKIETYDRSRANAELTRVLLQVTKTNLTLYAAWCREIAPGLVSKQRTEPALPEMIEVELGRRPLGVGFTNMCLCHGVKPFMKVEMPGGEVLRTELMKLDALVTSFMSRYAHTPYAVALHRAGLARFHFTYPGAVVRGPRPRPKSKGEEGPGTETQRSRPNRSGGSSGGAGSSGPTTGKE